MNPETPADPPGSAGLLLAAAGTSSDEAARTFRTVERLARARFPGLRIAWTFTSRGVRRKLAARGSPADEPDAALDRLAEAGVTRLAVTSLHMTAGMEYGELRASVESRRRRFEAIALGDALLDIPGLPDAMVESILRSIPAPPEGPDAVLLIAHGSREPNACRTYEAAAAGCRRQGRRVRLGTLLAPLSLPALADEFARDGVRTVALVPFTVAAGSSATQEMTGSDPASWQSVLEARGLACVPVLRGLGDREEIVNLWLQRAAELVGRVAPC